MRARLERRALLPGRSVVRMHRRFALAALCLLASAFVSAGCGDPYGTPLLASTRPPAIRVRLGNVRPTAELRIRNQGWDAVSIAGGAFAARGLQDVTTTLASVAGGIRFQGRATPATALRIRTARDFTLDGVTYAGTLIVRRSGTRLQLVNELDMETYVAGVIGNEVGPSAKPATYRAQAVAARTYAYLRVKKDADDEKPFHVYDSASSQVYRGMSPDYDISYEAMRKHTADTRGVVLLWKSQPFSTFYSSTCGGHTTDPGTSRLDAGHAQELFRGVPCRWCKTSKYYAWSTRVGDEQLEAGLRRAKRPISLPIHSIAVSERGRGGWVASVRIVYGPKRKVRDLPGPDFRTIARLRSHNIQAIERRAGGWQITGRGWGHGVGMCQWGAIEMGRAGASESDILLYYYPDATFARIY